MKLKHYISAKALKKIFHTPKSSREEVKDKYTINNNLVDYEHEPRALCSKDDSYLPDASPAVGVRMRGKSAHARARAGMTQSLMTDLTVSRLAPEYDDSLSSDTDCPSANRPERPPPISEPTDSGDSSETISHLSHSDDATAQFPNNPLCDSGCSSCRDDRQFHSLPSVPSSSSSNCPLAQSVQYSSLPLSMMQSCYIGSAESIPTDFFTGPSCTPRTRSRIRTNPWLPLPTGAASRCRPECGVETGAADNKRSRQPRLSRLFSEVEEILREQCAVEGTSDKAGSQLFDDRGGWLDVGSASKDSQAEPDSSSPLQSPSEGYRSACSSECELADSDVSHGSSATDERSKQSSSSLSGHHRPTLQDFAESVHRAATAAIPQPLSEMSMTESMFGSTISLRSEELQARVRKLCQSTTELDEKMRLARLEASYIRMP